MGTLKASEKLTMVAFVGLSTLWIFGKSLGVHSTAAALAGLSFLLIAGVLSWDDVLKEKGAWDTLVWFAALVMMTSQLNELGFISWFSSVVSDQLQGIGWQQALDCCGGILSGCCESPIQECLRTIAGFASRFPLTSPRNCDNVALLVQLAPRPS